jgi:hypothetical protein
MTIRISVNITDREECRVALDHIFYAHPGLAAEIQDGEDATSSAAEFKSTRVTGEAAAADPQVGVELDSRGVPWIDGVHATTKGKKADGTWTKRRGVDDAVVMAAEKEAVAELDATPEPSIPAETETAAPVTLPGSGGLPGADRMPGGSGELPGGPAETAPDPISHQMLVDLYTAKADENKVDVAGMEAIHAEVGTTFDDLQTNETARADVYARLEEL